MVRDNVTGLIWEAKGNKNSVQNYSDPHDADNTYTWYDPSSAYPGTSTDHDTDDFLGQLNGPSFGGFDDWRLPTVHELDYLVNYGIPKPGPSINTAYFPNTPYYGYWSSTIYGPFTYYAELIHFGGGNVLSDLKSFAYYARAVHGEQSPKTLVNNGDGTVTDTSTGLMWQQDTARDGQGNYDSMTWEEALAYCEGLTLGNHTDWRLPNIKELLSLVDFTRSNCPYINTTYFPNTVLSNYWSSTTDTSLPTQALSIRFDSQPFCFYSKQLTIGYVRAVRGGQSQPEAHVDIKANGSDGPVVVSSGTPVAVTVGLNPAQYAGFTADWWIAVKTPFGPPSDWYTYVYPTGWMPGVHLCAQTGLFAFSGFEVLNMALPVGSYTFYFAVDPPDGIPTAELLDSVVVQVN